MSIDCDLIIDAKITDKSGQNLVEYLSAYRKTPEFLKLKKKSEGCWKSVCELLIPLLDDAQDEVSVSDLSKGTLKVRYSGRDCADCIDFLVDDFFPQYLTELSVFKVFWPDFGTYRLYTFNCKSKKLLKKEKVVSFKNLDKVAQEFEAPQIEEWREMGKVEWRLCLKAYLELIQNIESQRSLLVEKTLKLDFDKSYTNFKIWFDMHSYFLQRLGFDSPITHFLEAEFLTESESKILKPFVNKFKLYLPRGDMLTKFPGPILSDEHWEKCCGLAKTVCSKVFP